MARRHPPARGGLRLHAAQLRIVLVFCGPGIRAGLRVATPSSIVDDAPTILELAGAFAHGVGLTAASAGDDLPRNRPLFFLRRA